MKKNSKQKCPCGSGRKAADCHFRPRRPRLRAVRALLTEPTTITDMRFNTRTGELQLMSGDKPIQFAVADAMMFYERPRKAPKVLAVMPTDTTSPCVDPNFELANFEPIVAIDTTYNPQDRGGLCATAMSAVIGVKPNERLPGFSTFSIASLRGFEFHGATENPERIGWMLGLQHLIAIGTLRGEKRGAVIVDSEASALPAINSRTQSISADFFVPHGFVLVHASDVATTDSLASAMIKHTDRLATELRRDIVNGESNHAFQQLSGNEPFSRLRFWDPLPEPRSNK